MAWSQIIVVGWLQFALASLGILWLARCVLRRMPQPVDRIRIIQCTLASTTLLPLLIAVAPWPAWRLEIVAPVQDVIATPDDREVPLHESSKVPFESGQVAPFAIDEEPISRFPEMTQIVVADRQPVIATSPPKAKPDVSWIRVLGGQAWTIAMLLILLLHAAALICFIGLRCLGWVQLRRLCRTATAADDALVQTWNRIIQEQDKTVRLLVSSSLDVPLMFGWRHPVVLIPQKLVNVGGAALSYCLVHEWAHIERHDFLAWRCVDACQILFWLQPAYWWLRKELRLCQDLLADNRSTRAAGDAIEYSALLVDFARQQMVVPVAGALTFMDQPSQLTRRVTMLLERTFLVRTRCTWKFSLAAVTAVAMLVLLISGIRIEATRAEEARDKIDSSSATEDPAEKPDKPAEAVKELPVTLKYTCSVVDKETAKGIANANVIVRRSVNISGVERILEETKHVTDADGKYEVVIPPEQVAEPALYIELAVEHKDYAARSGFGDGLRIIRKDEKLGDRPFFERTELYPGTEVTGTVVTPDGQPLAGVQIFGFSSAAANSGSEGWSRARATSDADGKFRVVFHKGGDAALWVIPKDFAVVKKILARQRGDLGQIQLSKGVRLSGQVLGVERAPIAGVPVNIEYADRGDLGSLPTSSNAFREAITDPHGRFTFDPLPPGDYRVSIDDHFENLLLMDQTRYSLPAIFVPKKVVLNAGSEREAVEIQAVPHIIIQAQNLDSEGKKTRGMGFEIHGTIDGESWSATAYPDQDGTLALKIPHGLRDAEIGLGINEHGAVRFRMGKGQPLRNDWPWAKLGTLNDDIEGFEVIRYKAPIVLISAVDSDKQPIAKLQIKAKYGKPRPDGYTAFANGSDIILERQQDGQYRTKYMLPDEEITFSITADGYSSADEKINLKEGETKELVVTLKKADATTSTSLQK